MPSESRGQAQGVNFANIANVERYHTALDSLANADPRTLQHHGDQALAMVRALADAGPELDAPRSIADDAVWFDVLAMFIVQWPTSASLGLALTALALIIGWTIRMRAWSSGLRGLAASLAAMVAAALGAVALGGLLQTLGALPVPWVAHPLPALLSLHGTCIAVGLAVARLVAGRKASAQALWAGTWLTWAAIGVATAILAPGASFLFVVPALVAGLVAWLRIEVAAAIPALVAGVVWLPIVLLVYDGVGFVVPVLACISSVVLVSALPALWIRNGKAEADAERVARRRVAAGAAGVVAICAVASVVAPRFSVAVPQRVNVVFRQDEPSDKGAPMARVYVEAAWAWVPWGKPPAAMVRALGEPGRVRIEQPWAWSSPVPAADVPRITMQGPEATVLTSGPTPGAWDVRVRLRSVRGARTLALLLPAGRVIDVVCEGRTAIPRRGAVVFRGVPAEGIELRLTAEGSRPIDLTVLDVTSGVPSADIAPTAHAVLEARPAEAVQTQEGDITIATRQLQL